MWGRGKAIFGPGKQLEQLGRGLLDYSIYQISRLYAHLFQTRRLFPFTCISLCQTCDPRAQPVLAQGVKFQLEDLKVLRRSPDLLNNIKIGQGQL